jgi:hypothetical protein
MERQWFDVDKLLKKSYRNWIFTQKGFFKNNFNRNESIGHKRDKNILCQLNHGNEQKNASALKMRSVIRKIL